MDKKELSRQYKENPPRMGVFVVKNLSNGKILVDCGQNVQGRLNSCKFQLEHGSHTNKELQADFTLTGKDQFTFEIVDSIEVADAKGDHARDLKTLEGMWIEKLQPFDERGYNKRKKG
jgi:hypothetical protein